MTTLFISDLHLDASRPEITRLFLAFLENEAPHADALYILGDLFEAWIGDDDPEPTRARICDALRELTASGVACFVLHGNRDFLLGEEFARRTGCVLLPDPVVAELDGERVLLTHGDALCTGDRAYQELRSTVRDERWQRRFLALPLAVRARLAERARAGSRAHTSRAVPDIMDVDPAAVVAAHRATGARRIIHGHTHRPAIHESTLDGAPAYRIVLGAWYEQGSVLIADSGRYELRELPRG
ncbi:MAG TPA: UDP-2,3-diacylglucosamine diphosphatase [Steroidobacteraceae bacterium]